MKRLCIMALAILLAVTMTACGGSGGAATFRDVQVSETEEGYVVTGSVSPVKAGENALFVYLSGGEEEGWQSGSVGDPKFSLEEDGGFAVTLTNAATRLTLYAAPRDADYSTPEALSKAALAETTLTVDIPPTSETTEPTTETTEPTTETTEPTTETTDPSSETTDPTTETTEPTTETTDPTSATTAPPPPSFILFADDGAAQDNYGELAYMGSINNGNDESMTVELGDTTQATVGASSVNFSYASPQSGSHWAGMMFLFGPGQYQNDPGAKGPDLTKVTKMSFYVKGSGGAVKFFVECDGGAQSSAMITPTGEWQLVTLELKDSWGFCNIPFGWACAERDADQRGGTIEFWVDGVQFE